MKIPIREVAAARPAAQVKVSNDHSRTRFLPPKPFQRAIGRKNSSPARSAIPALVRLSSQLARQRSGTSVMARPPSALAEKTPSLKRFGPRSGCGLAITSTISRCEAQPFRSRRQSGLCVVSPIPDRPCSIQYILPPSRQALARGGIRRAKPSREPVEQPTRSALRDEFVERRVG